MILPTLTLVVVVEMHSHVDGGYSISHVAGAPCWWGNCLVCLLCQGLIVGRCAAHHPACPLRHQGV